MNDQTPPDSWESCLVCPDCKGKLVIINNVITCTCCGSDFSVRNGVPCFVSEVMTDHQKSEFEYFQMHLTKIRKTSLFYNQNENCYNWVLPWINDRTVSDDSRIICVGASFVDDLPHVQSNYKFNIDHLSHRYAELLPEIQKANIRHIARVSEKLPFKDNYADIVYSRNSLDHVCNPVRTLLDINRVLKPEGKFYLFVYHNSNFIDSGETTVVNDDFVEQFLKRILRVEWMKIDPSESQGVTQPPVYSLPNHERLGFLYAICSKTLRTAYYSDEQLRRYEELTANFHSAVYYERKSQLVNASKHFAKVMSLSPFLKSDQMRILYSKIRYLAINDPRAFIDFFREFKNHNRDPFWWRIIIDSSRHFMK